MKCLVWRDTACITGAAWHDDVHGDGEGVTAQVSALFHIASTKEPPAIPQRLSKEGRDFLLRCFNR